MYGLGIEEVAGEVDAKGGIDDGRGDGGDGADGGIVCAVSGAAGTEADAAGSAEGNGVFEMASAFS